MRPYDVIRHVRALVTASSVDLDGSEYVPVRLLEQLLRDLQDAESGYYERLQCVGCHAYVAPERWADHWLDRHDDYDASQETTGGEGSHGP